MSTPKTSPQIRFFLGQDNSCHWYVVPLSRRKAWDKWCAIPEDDEASWDVPKWATQIDGPHVLSFTDWAEGDGDVDTTYAKA